MQRRPLNISAALALAIERQIEEILAKAKAACALQYSAEAGGDGDNPLRPGADLPVLTPPIVEPPLARPDDFWKRLRSKYRGRRFGS